MPATGFVSASPPTDRREESPHRGYAFPSQQSEADFYGEDRAELITINKILVALDLIEIRKEMVVRADPQGRRWKVPHNFYRVKDHGDDFTLGTRRRAARRRAGRPRPRRLSLRAARLLAPLRPDRRRQCLGTHPAARCASPRSGRDWPPGPPPKRTAPRPAPGPATPRARAPPTETEPSLEPGCHAAIFCARGR